MLHRVCLKHIPSGWEAGVKVGMVLRCANGLPAKGLDVDYYAALPVELGSIPFPQPFRFTNGEKDKWK